MHRGLCAGILRHEFFLCFGISLILLLGYSPSVSAQEYHFIQVRHSGKCLHQHGATFGNGDPITQWDCVNEPNVVLQKVPVGGDTFFLKFMHSGKCAHLHGDLSANGTPITQWDCLDLPNVKWREEPAGDGYVYLRSASTNKCLHQHGATFGNGDPITQWDCVNEPNVQWRFISDPGSARHLRKNVYTLSAAEITSLKQGVAAMKAKPDSDPTSWVYQAKMHAINSGSAAALQDNCQHRQFFFFSWHRMYIYYFERILRKASGDPNFTLPYWNYTDNWPMQASIPEAYRTPANATNPLYNNTRSSIYNAGGNLPEANVQYNIAFNATNFTTGTLGATSFGGVTVSQPAHFPSGLGSGLLERSPHNNVHNDISGDMASGESPRDPVFLLHHANIDRLWNRWIAQGNGRENPTSNSTWMNQEFFFFDEDGNQVALKGSQILNTVTQLNYRYDDDPVVSPLVVSREAHMSQQKVIASEILTTQKQPIRLTEKRQEVNITLPEDKQSTLLQSFRSNFANERIILQINGIQYDEPVGMTYLLFINLPESVRNPDHKNPHFIGTLSFFGKADSSAGGHHGTLAGFTEDYDITQVLQHLQGPENISLTIIPSYPSAPADRRDLQEMIAQMKPQGNPRFDEVTVIKFRVE